MENEREEQMKTWEWASEVPPGIEKAKVFFFDEDRKPTTKDKAKNFEIHEYVNGEVVMRIYT